MLRVVSRALSTPLRAAPPQPLRILTSARAPSQPRPPRPQPSPPSPPPTPPPDLHVLSPLARALRALAPPPALTFLLGGPGSGKGTLSAQIVSRARHGHVSVGALLRAAARAPTPEGRHIARVIAAGGFVAASTSTALLLRRLCDERADCVVDGFPRTLANAVLWETLGLRPARVVALEVDEDTMRSRLSRRGRGDDVAHVVERRIAEFRVEWHQIKDFYSRRRLLLQIDGTGSPEQVWQRFKHASAEWSP